MVGGWFCARKDNGQKATKSTEPDSLRALGVIRNGITDFIYIYDLYLYKVDAYWLILRCVKYPDDPIIFLKHSGMQCESWDSDILGQDLRSDSPPRTVNTTTYYRLHFTQPASNIKIEQTSPTLLESMKEHEANGGCHSTQANLSPRNDSPHFAPLSPCLLILKLAYFTKFLFCNLLLFYKIQDFP